MTVNDDDDAGFDNGLCIFVTFCSDDDDDDVVDCCWYVDDTHDDNGSC